jgi:hypothetical protein
MENAKRSGDVTSGKIAKRRTRSRSFFCSSSFGAAIAPLVKFLTRV